MALEGQDEQSHTLRSSNTDNGNNDTVVKIDEIKYEVSDLSQSSESQETLVREPNSILKYDVLYVIKS